MSFWDRKKRASAQKALKCKGDHMTLAYRIYKSIELHLNGEFDYPKYNYLRKLGPKSYDRESGDLKMAVATIAAHCRFEGQLFNMSLAVAMNHLLTNAPRAKLAHRYKYDNIAGKEYLIQKGKIDYPFDEVKQEGWIVEEETFLHEQFRTICLWYFNAK